MTDGKRSRNQLHNNGWYGVARRSMQSTHRQQCHCSLASVDLYIHEDCLTTDFGAGRHWFNTFHTSCRHVTSVQLRRRYFYLGLSLCLSDCPLYSSADDCYICPAARSVCLRVSVLLYNRLASSLANIALHKLRRIFIYPHLLPAVCISGHWYTWQSSIVGNSGII